MEISNTDISTFINMVDTFYNNAWNRLVLYGALIIVIAGIIMPIILQSMSQRVQKSKNIEMENKLRKELTSSINLEAKSIEEKDRNIISNYFKEKEMELKDMSNLLNKKISYSIGLNFHNLAVQSGKEGDCYHMIHYFISAAGNYIDAKNEGELKKILNALEDCGVYINKVKDSFDVKELKESLDNFISKLDAEYPDKRYSQEIRGIKKIFSKGIKITKNTN
jgi:replication initiation and membrane attachment protein DnaB